MKRRVLAACVLIVMNVLADITVSDVKVFSAFPWKEVAIGYRITGSMGDDVGGNVVGVWAFAEDKVNGERYESRSFLSTDLSEGYHVVKWNASEDGVKFRSDRVEFTIKVGSALYCAIDLSQGPSASSYPVTYLLDVPSGGWTDEYKTTKLVLRRIEAGTFIMGRYQTNEAHRVTLTKPFYIGVFEVTQKQWSLVMGSNPSSSTSYGKGDNYPVYFVSYDMIRGSSNGSKWPASSAVDATSFLGKLRSKTGLDFDLPTEAQWEYACRAGTATTYYWGSSTNGDYAWYSSNSGSKTHSVGTKRPNAWGLYDMSGNVWEWNLDWFATLSYGTDPRGSSSGSYRVYCGGSWLYDADSCTSSAQIHLPPSGTYKDLGFRLVRTLSN